VGVAEGLPMFGKAGGIGMANIMFDIMMGCPHCLREHKILPFINHELPFDEQIENLDILSEDYRVGFMSNLFKSDDISDWKVPITVLEKPTLRKIFGSQVEGTSRIFIESLWSQEHFMTMVLSFLKGR
jgi:hypothetical protein